MAKQSALTQESLIGALARLLKEKSIEDISVSELTKVAGISRMTFYRHYRNIIDVFDIEVANVLAEFQATITYHDNNQYILEMVLFFQQHSDFVKLLLRAHQEELLRSNIATVMGQLSVGKELLQHFSPREIRYYVAYHTAGLMNVIINWINDDQPETPAQLAQFLALNARE